MNTRREPQPPPMLSAGHGSVADVPGDWFLVNVRSQYEKALAWQLRESDFDYYLPLTTVRKRYANRHTFTLTLPLFDGYIFAAAEREPDGATMNKRLVEFLSEHQHVFVDEYGIGRVVQRGKLVSDLTMVEMALKANPALEVRTISQPGQKVVVSRGAWQGTPGVVDSFDNTATDHHVWIEIKTLGQSVAVSFDISDLELVD